MNFQNIIERLDSFEWNDWVYLNVDRDINLDSECAVLNPDIAELSDDGFTPKIAKERNISEFLQISDIRSVIENISHQGVEIDNIKIVNACKFYFKYDAFLSFQKE
ncbi:DUF7716 domain-containing protein [Saliniramus fredricksonii]|uniref:DUF7716 domain-containing protein n=1 Tax=Saliniramus fredricksonii TaxID=1653334 RepID=A0ABY0KB04_9HYPH|nr:hypothetical protein [Saliniramus fredricksonii]SCC81655.1 hypothetical protein GA0071312_2612 [Saliniramus fredricksonii]